MFFLCILKCRIKKIKITFNNNNFTKKVFRLIWFLAFQEKNQ